MTTKHLLMKFFVFFKNIVKFIFIFVIIFAAFIFALNNIFWYYNKDVRGAVEIITHNMQTSKAEESFST